MKSTLVLLAALVLSASAQPQTIVSGLQGPQRMVMTGQGNFLATETNRNRDSGRVSYVTRGGVRRTLLDHLPSGTDVTGGGSGPTALAIRNRTLYVAIGSGDAERMAPAGSTGAIYNPQGMSSALFSTILQIDFDDDVDSLAGTFDFTNEVHHRLADGFDIAIEDGAGKRARAAVLTSLPNAAPDAQTGYRFSNLWSLTFGQQENTLYAADASMNALLEVDTRTGRWRRPVRFAGVPNRGSLGGPFSEAVPTSVRVYGDRLLVSLLTGFPFEPGQSRVLLVDPERRTAEPYINGLNSAVDVQAFPRDGDRPVFYVLEYSQNQLAGAPGRLLRYDTPFPTILSDRLITPVSMVVEQSTGTVYVLQLSGEIVEVKAP